MQRAVGIAAFLAGCVGILSMPCPAFAQETSKVQAGGGYMYVADPWVAFTNSVSTESGAGWFAKIVGNVTPHVGVVGEVSGTYHDALNHRGIKGAARVYGMLGGVRLRPFCCRVAAPFAHVMAGQFRLDSRFTINPWRRFSTWTKGISRSRWAEVSMSGVFTSSPISCGCTITATMPPGRSASLPV